jgi:hypothetical protein
MRRSCLERLVPIKGYSRFAIFGDLRHSARAPNMAGERGEAGAVGWRSGGRTNEFLSLELDCIFLFIYMFCQEAALVPLEQKVSFPRSILVPLFHSSRTASCEFPLPIPTFHTGP